MSPYPCISAHSDLGVHIDGWIASQATSMVVQADPAAPVTGRAADVIAAAHTAMEAALRLVRPGQKIAAVPEILAKVRGGHGGVLLIGRTRRRMMSHVNWECQEGQAVSGWAC